MFWAYFMYLWKTLDSSMKRDHVTMGPDGPEMALGTGNEDNDNGMMMDGGDLEKGVGPGGQPPPMGRRKRRRKRGSSGAGGPSLVNKQTEHMKYKKIFRSFLCLCTWFVQEAAF